VFTRGAQKLQNTVEREPVEHLTTHPLNLKIRLSHAIVVGLFINKNPKETSLHVNAKIFGPKHAQYIGLTEK
jgi:hypothetical protein